ncbi:hypothetical protein HK100_006745, partial [Physocladia obscura]
MRNKYPAKTQLYSYGKGQNQQSQTWSNSYVPFSHPYTRNYHSSDRYSRRNKRTTDQENAKHSSYYRPTNYRPSALQYTSCPRQFCPSKKTNEIKTRKQKTKKSQSAASKRRDEIFAINRRKARAAKLAAAANAKSGPYLDLGRDSLRSLMADANFGNPQTNQVTREDLLCASDNDFCDTLGEGDYLFDPRDTPYCVLQNRYFFSDSDEKSSSQLCSESVNAFSEFDDAELKMEIENAMVDLGVISIAHSVLSVSCVFNSLEFLSEPTSDEQPQNSPAGCSIFDFGCSPYVFQQDEMDVADID